MKKILKIFVILAIGSFSVTINAFCQAVDQPLPKDVKNMLDRDLKFLFAISGNEGSEIHSKIFGKDVSGKNYKKYFKKRVKSIVYNDENILGGMLMTGEGNRSKKITVRKYFLPVAKNLSKIARISMMIHEAAHNGKNVPLHTFCPSPFEDENGNPIVSPFSNDQVANKLACDLDSTGAYTVQYVFLKISRDIAQIVAPKKKQKQIKSQIL